MTLPGLPPLRAGRRITGMSAVLLPFGDDGSIAWDAFAAGEPPLHPVTAGDMERVA